MQAWDCPESELRDMSGSIRGASGMSGPALASHSLVSNNIHPLWTD